MTWVGSSFFLAIILISTAIVMIGIAITQIGHKLNRKSTNGGAPRIRFVVQFRTKKPVAILAPGFLFAIV